MDCGSRAHADVYADAAQSGQHRIENSSLCNMLAAGRIPAPLLIFTAKSHDSREAVGWGGGGRVQTDSKSLREKEKKKKKTSAGDRERQGGGQKKT